MSFALYDFNAIPSLVVYLINPPPLMGEGWGGGDHNFFHPPLTPPIKGGGGNKNPSIKENEKIAFILPLC